jgi:hypothetical protein
MTRREKYCGGMARPERFELPTNWFEASYSIQLSYGRIPTTAMMAWPGQSQ